MTKISTGRIKILLLAVAVFAITAGVAAQAEKPYIEVNGVTEYKVVVQQYEATIVLSPTMDYNYPNSSSFSEIRKNFLEALRQSGFKEEQFKEDKLAYVTGDYQGEGTVYRFETPAAETFLKLKELEKVRGARVQYKKAGYKMPGDIKELMKKALDDARGKATDIAKVMNRKLGEPIVLSDLNTGIAEPYNYSYSGEARNYYQIVVRFALE